MKRKITPVRVLIVLVFVVLVLMKIELYQARGLMGYVYAYRNLDTVDWRWFWRAAAPQGFFGRGREYLGLATIAARDGGDALWRTPLGPIWAKSEDDALLEHLLSEQLIEKSYQAPGIHIEPGDIVIDAGSHYGVVTRLALSVGAAKVIGIEPNPDVIRLFRRTFAAELAAGSVMLSQAAAWKEAGTLNFEIPVEEAANAKGFVDNVGSMSVQAITIDDLLAELGINCPDFIKMDIEGAEREALLGAQKTIARCAPKMAVAFYHRANVPAELTALVRQWHPSYRVMERKGIGMFIPERG